MPYRMFKYRLYPSKTWQRVLEEQLELCRKTFNLMLLHCRSTYKTVGRIPTQYKLNNYLIILKQEYPELQSVHSQVLQNISKRVRDAYNGFFVRRNLGFKAGLPRFKEKRRYKSITYPQRSFKVEGGVLSLSKIGKVQIRLHRKLRGVVKTLTIKRMPSGKWFAVFSCVVEERPKEKPRKEVGIDVGLYYFAVLSDGTRIANPRYFRRAEVQLARLQRSLSRKEEGSSNREGARVRVARLYEKILNRRGDFLHKTSKWIADTYQTVYVEDLKIRNMVKNPRLAKSINDASWGRFTSMMAYKEEESGGQLIYVNPKNTSKVCNRCGNMVVKTLSQRIHECPLCGLVLDRDLNAARNILRIGRGPPDSKPVESMATIQPSLAVQVDSVNQEASLLEGK